MSIEAKVAQSAVKVATQSGQQAGINPMQDGTQSPFMSVLQQHEVKMDASNADIMNTLGYNSSHPADNAVSASHLEIQVSTVEQLDSVQSTDKVANMLSDLNRQSLNMEKIVEMVTSGPQLTSNQTIAVQAMVHQSALEIQIGVQAMDAGKTSIQTLVQRTSQ